ncbi:hypothetical protein [Streptomyces sp. NPDC059517]|uniref:hypothetical protein n=1 Tax=unclassified Streptomyces TaxID=2593676 RepID=UPI003627F45C
MEQPRGAARPAAVTAGMRCLIDFSAEGAYGWRLVAPNGRSVAVSADSHDSHTQCRAAFTRLCASRGELVGGIQHSSEGGGWIWLLWDAASRPVAAAARTYERHATCRSAYDRFRALLPQLDPARPELWGDT